MGGAHSLTETKSHEYLLGTLEGIHGVVQAIKDRLSQKTAKHNEMNIFAYFDKCPVL